MKKSFLFIVFFAVFACSDDFEVVEKVNHASRVASENLYEITIDSTWNGLSFTQGNCSATEAQNNLILLEHFITVADTSLVYEGLEITGSFDCFFAVGNNSNQYNLTDDGITLPSNFILQMSDGSNGTHLRVFDNEFTHSRLFGIYRKENVRIYGGNLYGSRLIANADNNESCLLDINSGRNIIIEDTKFFEANGDGISIHSWCHPYEIGYLGNESSQININNTFFDSNRGNGISVTDGNYITIKNSEFKDSSKNLPNSIGRGGSMAIDIEATRHREILGDINSSMILDQDAHHIKIDNCVEYGGRIHAFIVAIGHDVEITNNTTECGIGNIEGSNVVITNNIVTHDLSKTYELWQSVGIFTGFNKVTNMTHSVIVNDNKVSNYSIGIDLYQTDGIVSGNLIENCFGAGIRMNYGLKNYDIKNNIIKNTNSSGCGLQSYVNNTSPSIYLDNVTIRFNNVSLLNPLNTSKPLLFNNVNKGVAFENYRAIIQNNNFNAGVSEVSFNNTNGIVFKNNFLSDSNVSVGSNSTNIDIIENTITPNLSLNGIYISNSHYINVKNNIISLSPTSSQRCINVTLSSNLSIVSNDLTDRYCNGTLWIDRCTNSTIIKNIGHIGKISDSPSFLAITPNNNVFYENIPDDGTGPRNRWI